MIAPSVSYHYILTSTNSIMIPRHLFAAHFHFLASVKNLRALILFKYHSARIYLRYFSVHPGRLSHGCQNYYLLKSKVRIIAAMPTIAIKMPFLLFSLVFVKFITEPATEIPAGIRIANNFGIVFVA